MGLIVPEVVYTEVLPEVEVKLRLCLLAQEARSVQGLRQFVGLAVQSFCLLVKQLVRNSHRPRGDNELEVSAPIGFLVLFRHLLEHPHADVGAGTEFDYPGHFVVALFTPDQTDICASRREDTATQGVSSSFLVDVMRRISSLVVVGCLG